MTVFALTKRRLKNSRILLVRRTLKRMALRFPCPHWRVLPPRLYQARVSRRRGMLTYSCHLLVGIRVLDLVSALGLDKSEASAVSHALTIAGALNVIRSRPGNAVHGGAVPP